MNTLVIPVHLDALLLPNHTLVKNAIADYSLLPYTNKANDYNSDTPYLSEFILNHPFQDKNLLLRPGVHLHWSLPPGLSKTIGIRLFHKKRLDALKPYFRPEPKSTQDVWTPVKELIWKSLIDCGWIKPFGNSGRASVLNKKAVKQPTFEEAIKIFQRALINPSDAPLFAEALVQMVDKPLGADFPCVPDVWLVKRKDSAGQTTKSWIVESSFIANTQSESNGNLSSVNIPFHDDQHNNKSQPFRFMGRRLEGNSAWSSGKFAGENYLKEITAVGYNSQAGSKGFAEPSFAAFYPNCLSVFGFHDAEITTARRGLSYEVLGIYANPENDYLKIFLDDFGNRSTKQGDDPNQFIDALLNEFHYKIVADLPAKVPPDAVPAGSLLFGKAVPKLARNPDPSRVQIAVGNTGTEALSAYVASKLPGNKKEIEELLEAVQFSARLQNKVLDIGYKFQETRHAKGFTASQGGNFWSIKLESKKPQDSAMHNSTNVQEPALPGNLASLLNEANALQSAYDKANLELSYLKTQLYADWYKYMSCAYPPVDQKADFFDDDILLQYIRSESILPLKEKLQALGTAKIPKNEGKLSDKIVSGNPESAGGRLTTKLLQLVKAVENFNNEKDADGKSWNDKEKSLVIRSIAAPRFWRANDPAVLFIENTAAGQHPSTGPQATLTEQEPVLTNDRHDTPGSLDAIECRLLPITFKNLSDFSFAEAVQLFDTVSIIFNQARQTGSSTSLSIWNPFMMEWKVEYLPAFPGSNEQSASSLYDPQYINRHYQLSETGADLELTSNSGVFENANLFSGSTILTPHAMTKLDGAIEQFINDFKYIQSETTLQLLNSAKSFLSASNSLSQSLGGFHEALLLRKQTRQLDVADPLAFPDYASFTQDEVAPLVGKFNLTAPDPLGDFNPIRCGLLKILNLRLIDSYGRTVDFINPDTVNSEMVSFSETPATVHLKPRLSQPARINFRFLSASSGQEEMNAHPASSPVCGWILPNNLDHSLMFYDQDGSALGALTMDARNPWIAAPDSTSTTFIDSIVNLQLRKVARQLYDLQWQSLEAGNAFDTSFLKYFLDALNNALENIGPENFAEHQDLALLMGRPIAVIRAKLGIELQGPAYTDQSWTQLAHELQGQGRSTDDFIKVEFPIRLGDYKQANDGLLGYWMENEDGRLGTEYFSAEAGDNPDPHIVSYANDGQALNIYRTIEDKPCCVTMLADPMGSIHVTTGILPVKSVSIPGDQYKNALKRIAVTFLAAPVLSIENHLKLSLPKEPGYGWAWLERTGGSGWLEIQQTVVITKFLFNSKFPDQPQLWDQLVSIKWLEPLADDAGKALLTSAVQRAFPSTATDAFPLDIGKRLDNFFDAYAKRIEPFDVNVNFGGPLVIREGWLQLGETAGSVPDQKRNSFINTTNQTGPNQ